MEIDFSAVDEADDFATVPPGVYPCRVAEVREGTTRDGDRRWAMRLEVAEGEYAGRTAAWDGISLGGRGLRRAKFVLATLGFRTDGRVAIEPDELVGRTAWVELRSEEWRDPVTGLRTVRLRVPYLGYGTEASALAG